MFVYVCVYACVCLYLIKKCVSHPFSGKVVLASTKAVYVLVPLPLERQIQDLLAGHRVEEALTLTEGAQRNIPKDKFQVECLNVHHHVDNISAFLCLSTV